MDDLYQYTPSREADYALLQWMERMINDGEIDHTLTSAQRCPGRFLEFFRSKSLFFHLDSFGNIKRACWFEGCMGSAFWGVWFHPGVRHMEPKANLRFIDDMLDMAFGAGLNTVVGLIKQRETEQITHDFIHLHKRGWGFTYRGFVPDFFEGSDCHIVALTRKDWENFDGRKRRRGVHARGS